MNEINDTNVRQQFTTHPLPLLEPEASVRNAYTRAMMRACNDYEGRLRYALHACTRGLAHIEPTAAPCTHMRDREKEHTYQTYTYSRKKREKEMMDLQ